MAASGLEGIPPHAKEAASNRNSGRVRLTRHRLLPDE
jgi:hypothetical protein